MAKKLKKSNFTKNLTAKKWFYLACAAVLVIVATLYLHHRFTDGKITPALTQAQSDKIDYSPGTKADNESNNSRKSSSSPTSTLDNPTSSPNTGNFSVTITRASLDSSQQNLQIATLVNGITTGTCNLKVAQSGQATLTRSEDLILQVNAYVCPVINIPLSSFPNRGKWDVSMSVESNGKTVSSDWSANPVALSN